MLPYLTAALFSAVALVLAMILIRETVSPEQKVKARVARGFGAWRAALAHSQTRLLLFLMFAPPFVFAGIEVIIVLWSERACGVGSAAKRLFLRLDGRSPCRPAMDCRSVR